MSIWTTSSALAGSDTRPAFVRVLAIARALISTPSTRRAPQAAAWMVGMPSPQPRSTTTVFGRTISSTRRHNVSVSFGTMKVVFLQPSAFTYFSWIDGRIVPTFVKLMA